MTPSGILCFTCIVDSQGGAQPGQGGEFAPQPPAWPQFNPYEQSAMYGMHPQMQQQPNYNMNWQPPPYYGPPPGYFAPAFGPSDPPHEGMYPPPGHPASYVPVDQPSWHSNTSSAGSSGSAASSYSRRGSGSSRSPRRSRRASEKKQGRPTSSENRFDASMTLHQIKGERTLLCKRTCDTTEIQAFSSLLAVSISLRTRGQRGERPGWV